MGFQDKYEDLLRKAWTDAEFKARLMATPEIVLREEGWDFPAGMRIRVVENTNDVHYLVIPPSPPLAELDLEPVAVAEANEAFGTRATRCGQDGC